MKGRMEESRNEGKNGGEKERREKHEWRKEGIKGNEGNNGQK